MCNRSIHVVELACTYATDEYSNPAEILLPQRLLVTRQQVVVNDKPVVTYDEAYALPMDMRNELGYGHPRREGHYGA